MYEFPMHNDTATCSECGVEIDLPDVDDPDTDMKAPFWRRKEQYDPFDDVFDALCDTCYAEAVSEVINSGGEENV
jgi:hypothetical protein